jgi:murein L,D-transpeptidase YafK
MRFQLTLRSRPQVRALLTSAAIAAATALAACIPGSMPADSGRHMQPLSDRVLAELKAKNMEKGSPILVRIFKQEAELEMWKQDKTGRFALFRTYPICRWSGDLGPKMREGDRQAPEGFYTITPGLMNPNSNYYLAINTGFPNSYDRANGRTGALLMIHGDCSSAGCYAMTDEQIAEIYALARESFFGGQKSFQLEAFPFRMTPLNLAQHRDSPHMAFWKMLKEGYDHFEVTRREPKVNVCEKRYVFDAESMAQFAPAERCPAYNVPEGIAAAVRDKERRDDTLMADLINRGTPTVPVTTGVDGGMNPIFRAAVATHGSPGATIRTASGTIPAYVNPPKQPTETATASFGDTKNAGAVVPKPPSAPPKRQANAKPESTAGTTTALLGGAAPAAPVGSFDKRMDLWP